MDSIFSLMYVCISLGAQSRMAAVSETLIEVPRYVNVFSAASTYFQSSKIAFGLQKVYK